MIEKKGWEEFRATGLLWFINTTLHLFGWAIAVETHTGIAYPAKVKFRGFAEKNNINGYEKVTQYLKENIKEIEEGSK
jgi:hypothetical protein